MLITVRVLQLSDNINWEGDKENSQAKCDVNLHV